MRSDIQFLRGYAVSIVLLSHAGIGIPAGFLGVDIFFVVSGFLITRMLREQMLAGSFSFFAFYISRAKRLLPAAFVTFLLTAMAAPFFLGTTEMAEFRDQLYGALTFSANYVLLAQSGYFDAAAEVKPLLHIWSLSLEEQFYFIFPVLLLVVRTRFWIKVVALIVVGSGVYCAYLSVAWPDGSFYLLPSRAWELGIGALLALSGWADQEPPRLVKAIFWPAAMILLAIPLWPIAGHHPGLNAVVICIATAAVIAGQRSFFGARALRPMVEVGNASYSLYLTHWPVIALTNNAYFGKLSGTQSWLLLAVGVALGFALYLLVERPIHRLPLTLTFRTGAIAAAASLAMLFVPTALGVAASKVPSDFEGFRKPNYGMDRACDQGKEFKVLDACSSSSDPEVAVWGDSFAMHLVPALQVSSLKFIQLTRSSCPPVFGYAQFEPSTRYTEEWAHSCVEFNRAVLAYLTRQTTIHTVVIASTFSAFTVRSPWKAVVYGKGKSFRVQDIDQKTSETVLAKAVQKLRSLGKKVVLVAPPPAGTIDVGRCLERVMADKIVLGTDGCSIPREVDKKRHAAQMAVLEAVSTELKLNIVDLRPFLCNDDVCNVMIDHVPIYRDATHISVPGSRLIGEKFDLARQLVSGAR